MGTVIPLPLYRALPRFVCPPLLLPIANWIDHVPELCRQNPPAMLDKRQMPRIMLRSARGYPRRYHLREKVAYRVVAFIPEVILLPTAFVTVNEAHRSPFSQTQACARTTNFATQRLHFLSMNKSMLHPCAGRNPHNAGRLSSGSFSVSSA